MSKVSFAKRIENRVKTFEKRVEDTLRDVAGKVHETVVMRTPIDTGRARANWQLTLNSAPDDPIAEDFVFTVERFQREFDTLYSLGARKEARELKQDFKKYNANNALFRGRDVLKGFKRQDTIYITNNVHYILKLNAGSSRQAPAGFIQMGILSATSFVKNVKLFDDTVGE